jgi:hypothetical protein
VGGLGVEVGEEGGGASAGVGDDGRHRLPYLSRNRSSKLAKQVLGKCRCRLGDESVVAVSRLQCHLSPSADMAAHITPLIPSNLISSSVHAVEFHLMEN